MDALDGLCSDLVRRPGEGIAVDQVPRVPGQLAADVGDDPGRAEQFDMLFAGKKDAQQVVEADEVVHVRMRDEYVRELEQRRRGLAVDAAEIEQHGAALVSQPHVEARIAKGRVDQTGHERSAHGDEERYRGSIRGTSGSLRTSVKTVFSNAEHAEDAEGSQRRPGTAAPL